MATEKAESDALQVFAASSETESQLSTLLYDLSQRVQSAMEDMLKVSSEVGQASAEVTVEIGKCKDLATERKEALNEEKEKFQKAAYAVLEMLNN